MGPTLLDPLRGAALQTGPLTTELSWDLSPTVRFSSGFKGQDDGEIKLWVGDQICWPSLVGNLGTASAGGIESPPSLTLRQSPAPPWL